MAHLSERGLQHLKEYEGCSLTAYRDPAGILTVGYGHTGPEVHEGQVITAEEAEALLRADVRRFEEGVESRLQVPLNQGEFDSLVSFAFNIGLGAFRNSTLLRYVNESRHEQAAAEFARWVYANGKPLPGLVRRRAAEEALYREGGRA